MLEWLGNMPDNAFMPLIAVLSLIFGVAWWAATFTHKTWGMENGLKDLGNVLRDVRDNTRHILYHMNSDPLTQKGSPVKLTESGEEVSKQSNVREWAENQAPILLTETKEKDEFDTFEICVRHVTSLFENDLSFKRKVQSVAYYHGTDTVQIRKVYEVVLRDVLMGKDRN